MKRETLFEFLGISNSSLYNTSCEIEVNTHNIGNHRKHFFSDYAGILSEWTLFLPTSKRAVRKEYAATCEGVPIKG